MKKVIITMWLSSIFTFGGMATYLNTISDRINSPGEMGEVLVGIGIILAVTLAIFSLALSLYPSKKS